MRRRITVLVGALAVVLAGAAVPASSSSSPAQQRASVGRFVVLMAADPVVSYDGGVRGLRATSPGPRGEIRRRAPAVRSYVGHLERQHGRALRRVGAARADVSAEYSYALNGFAATLTAAEADAMTRQPGVVAVVRDRMRQPQTDNTPDFLGLTDGNGPWDSDIVGEDVVVGVIDTGIWPEHPSFADDGSFPPLAGRPVVPCEFGATAHNPDDLPFACNNKLLGARDMRLTYKEVIGPETYDSARDDDGHGTHTASTAAGNSDVPAEIFGISRGTLSGIAPRARVVAYKACGEQGCFGSDLAAAIDAAVADRVDVINYSIGGGATLTGPDALAFLGASEAGVFAATSAGNAGPGSGTVGGPSSVPWVTSVAASTQDRTFEGSVTLGDGQVFAGASITDGTEQAPLVDSAALGNELCLADQPFTGPVTGSIVLCKRGENARLDKSRAVFEAGGAGMVLYDVSDTAALITDNHFVPSVHIDNTDGLAVKAFITDAGDTATAQLAAGERAPSQGSAMADFSSRGPNPAALDLIKPDITAPGVNILAGNSPTPVLGAPGQLFQSISGTSMSSPHMAGIYALIRQAHPRWTPAMAKSAAMTTARQDVAEEDGQTQADPFDYGAGHVRPGGPSGPGSLFRPGLVYDAGTPDYLAFLCGTAPEVIVNPAATCAQLEAAGFSTDPSDLNYPSIGVAELAGTQTVTRTVTSVAGATARTFTAGVEAPPGFDVSVSPAQITLAGGESATFEVRIRNTGTPPVGRFAFGALTWTDAAGTYAVRSPIAVAASELDAAALVRSTGRSGRVGFPVKFGYTGPYRATAHGFVPRRTTPGTVAQDPDQTFDPTDPAGTTAHRFRMTGTAYMRWRLTHPNNAVDLDMYLFDAAGAQVASSAGGGTDETIALRLPANQVFTLYVHGWQTVATPVERYRLRTWRVPRNTRGPLRVVRAPRTGVLGQTRRVAVAWRGLAPNGQFFGAVTHHGPGHVVGLTVTRVTTGPGR